MAGRSCSRLPSVIQIRVPAAGNPQGGGNQREMPSHSPAKMLGAGCVFGSDCPLSGCVIHQPWPCRGSLTPYRQGECDEDEQPCDGERNLHPGGDGLRSGGGDIGHS